MMAALDRGRGEKVAVLRCTYMPKCRAVLLYGRGACENNLPGALLALWTRYHTRCPTYKRKNVRSTYFSSKAIHVECLYFL